MQTFVLKRLTEHSFVWYYKHVNKQMFSDIMFDVNVRYEMKNILMMLGMCLTVLFGYNMSNSVTEVNTHNNVREVKVQAGDTMWDIAARTAHKDMDVREMVYAMKELNNISDSGALVPGTVLKVPANKSDSQLELWTIWLKTKYIWVYPTQKSSYSNRDSCFLLSNVCY